MDDLPLAGAPLACSLGADDLDGRLEQWRSALAGVIAVAYDDETAELLAGLLGLLPSHTPLRT